MDKTRSGSSAARATRHDAAVPHGQARAPLPMHPPDLRGARIGVVIPAYRVATHIERVIRGVPAWVERIIVVEDAGPDDTCARVESLRDPRVTLLRHAENQGVGGAMATGFAEALRQGLDVIVKMDGDDQMDPVHLPRIVEPLLDGRADMVKCNRYSSLGSLRQMPLVRIAGNAGLTFLVKLASGYWTTFDPANGYIAIRASALERIDLAKLPRRYFFESGFLIELGIQRAVVLDVPIEARYGDESSSLSVTKTLFEFPPKLLFGLSRRLFWRYFVHDFSAVSVFLVLGVPALLFGIAYALGWFLRHPDPSEQMTPADAMIAAMSIIIGVQLVLQAIVLDIAGVPRVPLSPHLERQQRHTLQPADAR